MPETSAGTTICAEEQWSFKGHDGSFARGHLVPCKAKAKFLARWPGYPGYSGNGDDWTPLCGRHANTGRWANYPDIEWIDLAVPHA